MKKQKQAISLLLLYLLTIGIISCTNQYKGPHYTNEYSWIINKDIITGVNNTDSTHIYGTLTSDYYKNIANVEISFFNTNTEDIFYLKVDSTYKYSLNLTEGKYLIHFDINNIVCKEEVASNSEYINVISKTKRNIDFNLDIIEVSFKNKRTLNRVIKGRERCP